MLFDTHAHYYSEAFDPDRDEVLSALPAAGVGLVLCPGCDLPTSRQSIDLAERYPHVYAAAGVHPEDAPGPAGGLAGPGGGHDPPPQGEGHRGDRPGLLLAGESPGTCSRRSSAAQLQLAPGLGLPRHRPRPGGPRATAWPWCRSTPACGGCSTATPARRRTPRPW